MQRSFRLKNITSGEMYSLDKPSVLIGRSPQCDIFIDSTLLSRHHASILLLEDASVVVKDLESTNGTFVNSMRISRSHPLEHNDVITIGDNKFIFIDHVLDESGESNREDFGNPSQFVGQDATSNKTMVQSSLYRSLGLDPSTFNFVGVSEDDSLGGANARYDSSSLIGHNVPALFVIKSGRKKGGVIRLFLPAMAEQEWAVGRDQLCDVVLEDPTVSSTHAIIRCQDGCWRIEDCHSTNGVKLNGQPVSVTEFHHDDVISIGSIKLLFQVVSK